MSPEVSSMSRSRSGARRLLVQALYEWQIAGEPPEGVDLDFYRENPHGRADMAYFEALFRDVLSDQVRIDEALSTCVDRPLAEVDPVEKAVLRMGGCEMLLHPDVPYRVVINEAVEQAKIFAAEDSHKYVNGVLDKLALKLRPREISGHRNTRPEPLKSTD